MRSQLKKEVRNRIKNVKLCSIAIFLALILMAFVALVNAFILDQSIVWFVCSLFILSSSIPLRVAQ